MASDRIHCEILRRAAEIAGGEDKLAQHLGVSNEPLSTTVRTMRRAFEIVGTKEHLAATLNVTLADLDSYLEGEKPVPLEVFFDAVNVLRDYRQPEQ